MSAGDGPAVPPRSGRRRAPQPMARDGPAALRRSGGRQAPNSGPRARSGCVPGMEPAADESTASAIGAAGASLAGAANGPAPGAAGVVAPGAVAGVMTAPGAADTGPGMADATGGSAGRRVRRGWIDSWGASSAGRLPDAASWYSLRSRSRRRGAARSRKAIKTSSCSRVWRSVRSAPGTGCSAKNAATSSRASAVARLTVALTRRRRMKGAGAPRRPPTARE